MDGAVYDNVLVYLGVGAYYAASFLSFPAEILGVSADYSAVVYLGAGTYGGASDYAGVGHDDAAGTYFHIFVYVSESLDSYVVGQPCLGMHVSE